MTLDLRKTDGTELRKFVATIGDGISHTAIIHHGFDTKDLNVSVYDAEGDTLLPGLFYLTPDSIEIVNIEVTLGKEPIKRPIPKDGWKVVIIG